MNWPQEIRIALLAGIASVAVAIALDVSGLLDYAPWTIYASFPCGALSFLLVRILTEKVMSP